MTWESFGRDILSDWPDIYAMDGFELQEAAEKHGVLVRYHVTAPCCDSCKCAEYHDTDEMAKGVDCFRVI